MAVERQVKFRVSEEEWASLVVFAEASSVTVAGLAKQAVLDRVAAPGSVGRFVSLGGELASRRLESYPGAPVGDPVARREFMDARNEAIQRAGIKAPPSGTFGRGEVPKAKS